MPVKRIRFYVDTEDDADIIERLEQADSRALSALVRDIFRRGMEIESEEQKQRLEFLSAMRQAIREELRAMSFAVPRAENAGDSPHLEDPVVSNLLEGLLAWEE